MVCRNLPNGRILAINPVWARKSFVQTLCAAGCAARKHHAITPCTQEAAHGKTTCIYRKEGPFQRVQYRTQALLKNQISSLSIAVTGTAPNAAPVREALRERRFLRRRPEKNRLRILEVNGWFPLSGPRAGASFSQRRSTYLSWMMERFPGKGLGPGILGR